MLQNHRIVKHRKSKIIFLDVGTLHCHNYNLKLYAHAEHLHEFVSNHHAFIVLVNHDPSNSDVVEDVVSFLPPGMDKYIIGHTNAGTSELDDCKKWLSKYNISLQVNWVLVTGSFIEHNNIINVPHRAGLAPDCSSYSKIYKLLHNTV